MGARKLKSKSAEKLPSSNTNESPTTTLKSPQINNTPLQTMEEVETELLNAAGINPSIFRRSESKKEYQLQIEKNHSKPVLDFNEIYANAQKKLAISHHKNMREGKHGVTLNERLFKKCHRRNLYLTGVRFSFEVLSQGLKDHVVPFLVDIKSISKNFKTLEEKNEANNLRNTLNPTINSIRRNLKFLEEPSPQVLSSNEFNSQLLKTVKSLDANLEVWRQEICTAASEPKKTTMTVKRPSSEKVIAKSAPSAPASSTPAPPTPEKYIETAKPKPSVSVSPIMKSPLPVVVNKVAEPEPQKTSIPISPIAKCPSPAPASTSPSASQIHARKRKQSLPVSPSKILRSIRTPEKMPVVPSPSTTVFSRSEKPTPTPSPPKQTSLPVKTYPVPVKSPQPKSNMNRVSDETQSRLDSLDMPPPPPPLPRSTTPSPTVTPRPTPTPLSRAVSQNTTIEINGSTIPIKVLPNSGMVRLGSDITINAIPPKERQEPAVETPKTSSSGQTAPNAPASSPESPNPKIPTVVTVQSQSREMTVLPAVEKRFRPVIIKTEVDPDAGFPKIDQVFCNSTSSSVQQTPNTIIQTQSPSQPPPPQLRTRYFAVNPTNKNLQAASFVQPPQVSSLGSPRFRFVDMNGKLTSTCSISVVPKGGETGSTTPPTPTTNAGMFPMKTYSLVRLRKPSLPGAQPTIVRPSQPSNLQFLQLATPRPNFQNSTNQASNPHANRSVSASGRLGMSNPIATGWGQSKPRNSVDQHAINLSSISKQIEDAEAESQLKKLKEAAVVAEKAKFPENRIIRGLECIVCRMCARIFRKGGEKAYRAHVLTQHMIDLGDNYPNEPESNSDDEDDEDTTRVKVKRGVYNWYKCHKCGILMQKDLEVHQKTCSGIPDEDDEEDEPNQPIQKQPIQNQPSQTQPSQNRHQSLGGLGRPNNRDSYDRFRVQLPVAGSDTTRELGCGICLKNFDTPTSLRQHLSALHPQIATKVLLVPFYRCGSCMESFKDTKNLIVHCSRCENPPSEKGILELAIALRSCEMCRVEHETFAETKNCYKMSGIDRCAICLHGKNIKANFSMHMAKYHARSADGCFCPFCPAPDDIARLGRPPFQFIKPLFDHVLRDHYTPALIRRGDRKRASEPSRRTNGNSPNKMSRQDGSRLQASLLNLQRRLLLPKPSPTISRNQIPVARPSMSTPPQRNSKPSNNFLNNSPSSAGPIITGVSGATRSNPKVQASPSSTNSMIVDVETNSILGI